MTITDYGSKSRRYYSVFGIIQRGLSAKAPEPKTSGNKKEFVRLYSTQTENLEPVLVGVLTKLANVTEWKTGKLKSNKVDELAKYVKCSRAALYKYINTLQELGAIKHENGDYIINRDYVARG